MSKASKIADVITNIQQTIDGKKAYQLSMIKRLEDYKIKRNLDSVEATVVSSLISYLDLNIQELNAILSDLKNV